MPASVSLKWQNKERFFRQLVSVVPEAERQLAAVRDHLGAFVEEVGMVGVQPEGARTFLSGELLSVRFDVRELYDQTPGPQAGQRL